jgi:hypothetical protein
LNKRQSYLWATKSEKGIFINGIIGQKSKLLSDFLRTILVLFIHLSTHLSTLPFSQRLEDDQKVVVSDLMDLPLRSISGSAEEKWRDFMI